MKHLLACMIFLSAAWQGMAAQIEVRHHDLQSIVRHANPGDTLIIHPGRYVVKNLVIDKPLSLHGVNFPVLDGAGAGSVITVEASGCTIRGLRIVHSGGSDLEEFAGIRLNKVSGCVIEENLIDSTYFGIYLASARHCLIRRNRIRGQAVRESASGNAIHLWYCNHITITGNELSGHRDGIYIEFARNSKVIGNTSIHNLRYGLHFMFSDSSTYSFNRFSKNGTGVAVMYTRNVVMSRNTFRENQGSNAYGLLLKDITHSTITGNYFTSNTSGLYMEGSNDVTVQNNRFVSNGAAIRLLGNCFNDTLRLNDFTGNTFDVTTNAQNNMNLFENNYWDHYTGYDLDKNGKGDIPYYPVNLYSKVTEEYPASLILLNSFFTNVLDRIEHLIPTLIPAQFADHTPRMNPVNR